MGKNTLRCGSPTHPLKAQPPLFGGSGSEALSPLEAQGKWHRWARLEFRAASPPSSGSRTQRSGGGAGVTLALAENTPAFAPPLQLPQLLSGPQRGGVSRGCGQHAGTPLLTGSPCPHAAAFPAADEDAGWEKSNTAPSPPWVCGRTRLWKPTTSRSEGAKLTVCS